MPSEKYSLPLSSLRLENARTATDLAVVGAAVVGGVVGLVRKRLKASRPTAATATATMNVANFRGLQVGRAASGATFSVRFNPSGVSSNAHAITSAIGKPSATSTTSVCTTHSGARNVGNTVELIWTTSQPTIAYATATL